MQANAGKQSSGKGNQGKSWSKSESSITGKGNENNAKSTGRFLWTSEGAIQVSKGSGNGKALKTGYLRF